MQEEGACRWSMSHRRHHRCKCRLSAAETAETAGMAAGALVVPTEATAAWAVGSTAAAGAAGMEWWLGAIQTSSQSVARSTHEYPAANHR